MQNIFLEKYNDNYLKEEIFKMNKNEDEILEDLIERFMHNVKRENYIIKYMTHYKPSYLEELGMSGLIFLIS